MKKYVQLYEEFNPNEAKAKLIDGTKKIKKRMASRKDRIKAAIDRKDKYSVEIHKTRDEIDELQLQRLKKKADVIALRVKKKGN